MNEWRQPLNSRVLMLALGTLGAWCGAAALLAVALVRVLPAAPATAANLGLLALGLLALVLAGAGVSGLARLVRLSTLRYRVDRDAVLAVWRGGRCVIPLHHLAGVGEDRRLPEVRLGMGGRTQIVVLQTGRARYMLAVADIEVFTREVGARIALGVVRPQPEGLFWTHATARAFTRDRFVRGAGLAVLLLIAGLSAVAAWRFERLPPTVVVRYDPLGGAAGTRERGYVLALLAVGAAAALGNFVLAALLYGRSVVASQMLVLGALLLQLLLAMMLIGVTLA